MKGDFSRIRFNPAQEYVAVLKQQGRVDLDSDANEQRAIDLTLRETTNVDVIGPLGGPEIGAGFAISVENGKIWISPGRYYVDGVLVENQRRLNYDDQPYLIDPGTSAEDLLQQLIAAGDQATLQFVLEVWQRMVTALDDPCLLEPALGQADTTTRLQTVWRVVGTVTQSQAQGSGVEGADEDNPISQLSDCCQAMYNNLSNVERSGAMRAGLSQGGSGCGCQPIPAAGYQGLENQLYRVEIHNGGDLSTATFKWSRENGSVVAAVTGVSLNSNTITVASLGPDANLGFQAGQWVELSDDSYLFGATPNQPGMLYQISSVNQAALQVTMTSTVGGLDTSMNARMRRWDQSGSPASSAGISLSNTPIGLENGIEVAFRKGQYESGDYWTIPARTANGSIDWPPCGGNGRQFQSPSYMQVHQAPVACVSLRRFTNFLLRPGQSPSEIDRFIVNDCRLLFPSLTSVAAMTPPEALHLSAISWTNDDVMTVDELLLQGLAVTLDQAPTCPWSGANFQVTLEVPLTQRFYPVATGASLNFTIILASPLASGIAVSGDQVIWLYAFATENFPLKSALEFWISLNTILSYTSPSGAGRVRVKLDGGAVYGNGTTGNIYLDGLAFGSTSSRASDGSECIALGMPTGSHLKASDFDGWFYLAPSVLIESASFELVESTGAVAATAVTVTVNEFGFMTGLETTAPAGAVATPVSAVQIAITFSYTPVAALTLRFNLSGTGVGTVVSVPATFAVAAGLAAVNVPVTISQSPGAGVTDTVTLNVAADSGFQPLGYGQQLTLAITGGQPPTTIFHPEPIKFNF